MLQRLGNSSAICPRLEVPFTTWLALLENEQWRHRLYQQQQGKQQISPSVNLGAWLQGIYEASWQAIETFNSNTTNLAFNFRNHVQLNAVKMRKVKTIELGEEADSQKVVLLMALTPLANEVVAIRVQLHPLDDEYLPLSIKLTLLSESGEMIQEVPARIEDDYIQLKLFEAETGEGFSINVALDNYQFQESFIL